MGPLNLELLRQVIDPSIRSFTLSPIKTGAAPSIVYRVALISEEGHPPLPSLILKVIAPHWPNDPWGELREFTFYREILPSLSLRSPRVYYLGLDERSGARMILMEDLSTNFRFYPPDHAWSRREMQCLLRSYALLHSEGTAALPTQEQRSWLAPRHERRCTLEGLQPMAEELSVRGVWSSISGLGSLLERTAAEAARWQDWPVTLLHCDGYSPNFAMPQDLEQEGVLIDWEMISWGIAEIDLAYLFMQPFCSAREIDREEALDYYWAQRRIRQGAAPARSERMALQAYADSLLAITQIPVAYRVACSPFPSGSEQGQYWEAMFKVLNLRLQEMSETRFG